MQTTSRMLGSAAAVCLGCALQAADASDEDIIRQWKGMVLPDYSVASSQNWCYDKEISSNGSP